MLIRLLIGIIGDQNTIYRIDTNVMKHSFSQFKNSKSTKESHLRAYLHNRILRRGGGINAEFLKFFQGKTAACVGSYSLL